jgi:hypothetical protein
MDGEKASEGEVLVEASHSLRDWRRYQYSRCHLYYHHPSAWYPGHRDVAMGHWCPHSSHISCCSLFPSVSALLFGCLSVRFLSSSLQSINILFLPFAANTSRRWGHSTFRVSTRKSSDTIVIISVRSCFGFWTTPFAFSASALSGHVFESMRLVR